MDRRELRSKKKIDKLAKDCRTLQKKIKELGCEKEKLAKSNTTLRVQVCSLTRRLRQKEQNNKRNLRRLHNLRAENAKRKLKQNIRFRDEYNQLQRALSNRSRHIAVLNEDLKCSEENYAMLEKHTLEQVHKEQTPDILQTHEGKKYTNVIRQLYYQLLSKQLPPSKIEGVIKCVLQTFCPHIDIAKLELPKTALATRMRASELPTVNLAQEATVPSSNVLGSDGTTLNQKKVQGTRMGGLTLGVDPVADGSATSLISQLDKTFTTMRNVGAELNLPEYRKIGWQLVRTVMSDQDSTQKVFTEWFRKKLKERKR